MERLQQELDRLIATLPNAETFRESLETLISVWCDVFVWIGVWRDVIRYWVLAAKEMEGNRYYSAGQHRGNIDEGQLHLKDDNIAEFSQYEAKSNQLAEAIRKASGRQRAQ